MERHSVGGWEPAVVQPVDSKLRDLALLGELCRCVARADRGLRIGMRDAIPRLELSFPGGLVVDVRVDDDGSAFVCRPSLQRFPTCDIQAAAGALAELLRSGERDEIR